MWLGWSYIAKVFGPGSWHEPGPLLLASPRGALEVIGPGSCHEPGPMLLDEPGSMAGPDEPGPLAGIGPAWPFEPGWMGFGGRIKEVFSTSA